MLNYVILNNPVILLLVITIKIKIRRVKFKQIKKNEGCTHKYYNR